MKIQQQQFQTALSGFGNPKPTIQNLKRHMYWMHIERGNKFSHKTVFWQPLRSHIGVALLLSLAIIITNSNVIIVP